MAEIRDHPHPVEVNIKKTNCINMLYTTTTSCCGTHLNLNLQPTVMEMFHPEKEFFWPKQKHSKNVLIDQRVQRFSYKTWLIFLPRFFEHTLRSTLEIESNPDMNWMPSQTDHVLQESRIVLKSSEIWAHIWSTASCIVCVDHEKRCNFVKFY